MANLMLENRAVRITEPWRMLLFLLLAQLLVAFVGRSIGPLGVLIGEDLSLTKSQIGMLPAALFLGQAASSVPAGFLTDRFGSRRLLFLASFIVALGFITMTLFGEFWIVLLSVIMGGIGYGAMHPITNRGIIYWFPLKQRGTAMGVKQTGITAGSALASLILLPLGEVLGWKIVLQGACILLVIIGAISYLVYRDPPVQGGGNRPIGLIAFYKSMFKMIQNKALLLVSFSAMGLSGAQMCLNTYIVLFAYEKLGISLVLSGILLVISEVCGSLGRIIWGIISDTLFNGNRVLILQIITVLSAISSVTVALIPEVSFWTIAPIIGVFGFSISGFNGIWMNLASEIVPREQSGISSGVSITLGSMGVVIIPPIFGLIVDQTGSFTYGWLLITGMMIVVFSILCYLMVISKRIYKSA